MSSSPNVPEGGETYRVEPAATPRWVIVLFVLLFAAVAYVIYAEQAARKALEADIARSNQRSEMLAAKLEQADARLAEMKGQLDVTSEKLGLTQEELGRARQITQSIRKEQSEKEKELATKIGQVKEESEAKLGRLSGDVTGAKTDIEATRKDLEATKTKLERTYGDMGVMSGLIARNHEELEDLKRRGERNYFDFDIRKSNAPQRVGPIQIRLKKADPKKLRYTMDVVADDKTVEKKDKTINEPVQFVSRASRPVQEIVVFAITKDRIAGYLSAPK